jgi:hypothetical protein
MGQIGHAHTSQGWSGAALEAPPRPWVLTLLVRAACRSIAYAADFRAVNEGSDALDVWLGVGLPLPVLQVGEGVRATAPAARF